MLQKFCAHPFAVSCRALPIYREFRIYTDMICVLLLMVLLRSFGKMDKSDPAGMLQPRSVISLSRKRRMNRSKLVATIAEKGNITCVKAGKALAIILEQVAESLENGDRVTLSGFGSFRPVHREPQKGRNPHTGEELIIPARNIVRFRPGKILLEKVR